MAIKFDKETHKYTNEEGKELISVTTLLRKHHLSPDYGDVPEEVLKKAAERGTLVHEEIDTYIKTKEEGFSSELESFIAEVEKRGLRVVKNEYFVHNDIIAGQVDCLFVDKEGNKVLVDFKTTSTIHKESVTWQTNIYADLDDEVEFDETKDKLEVWHFDKEGNLEVIPLVFLPTSEIDRLYAAERNGETYTQEIAGIDEDIKKLTEFELAIADFEAKKKAADAQAKSYREKIMDAMNKNGIKSYESDILRFTIREGGERKTIDTAKLFKENPELKQEDYTKTSTTKPTLLITIKSNEVKKVEDKKDE